MKLTELQGRLFIIDRVNHHSIVPVQDVRLADGLKFVCPDCEKRNHPFHRSKHDPEGQHIITCWFSNRGYANDAGRWHTEGTTIDDLTFVPPGNISVLAGPCGWHGYIHNGEVVEA
jgi:hypothetical protein